jgi:phosphoenolpyruvate carboxykinase (ATP)
MVKAAIGGEIDQMAMVSDPIFGLLTPTSCPHVPSEMLSPRETWLDQGAYDQQAQRLAELFKKNFTQFRQVSESVRSAGPR